MKPPVREALEGTGARQTAAAGVEERVLRAAESPLERLAGRQGEVAVEAAREAGNAVHRLVLDVAGNRVLRRLLEPVNGRLRLAALIAYYDPRRVRDSIRERLAILAALRARDADAVEAAARAHVAQFREHIFRMLGRS